MLDLRKVEIGKYRIHLQRGNLVMEVDEIVSSFQLLSKKKNLDFNYYKNQDELFSYYDKDIIEKILYNLLSNAFKYSPEGGSVSLRAIYNEEDEIQFIVTDSGSGIPDEEKEFIFERFYRTSKAKFRNTEGSGIGLALTRDLVQLYGGAITIHSVPGSGASFVVKLPVYHRIPESHQFVESGLKSESSISHTHLEAVEVEYSRQSETLPEEASLNPERATVLIAEDNTDLREYLKKNLEEEYNIILAGDGKTGMEKCEIFHPDVIVSDIMMPVMDGIAFCRKIKENIHFNHIPVILLTAKLTDEDKISGLETGADDYINKPFNMEVLKASISNLVKNRERLREKYSQDLLSDTFKKETDNVDREFLAKLVKVLEENLADESFGVDSLARAMSMGRTSFYKKLKTLTGYTVNDFIKLIRLKKAEFLIRTTSRSLSEIYFEVGFSDGSYFASCFQKQYSMLPSEYRQRYHNKGKAAEKKEDT
jgi:CheY-like chemotaxis protein